MRCYSACSNRDDDAVTDPARCGNARPDTRDPMTVPRELTGISDALILKVLEADPSTTEDAVREWSTGGLTVRVVRGEKMRSTPALMVEVSAALQFPHYFGENWPAFDECLADMDWLMPTQGIIVVIRNAIEVLSEEIDDELETFVRLLRKATSEYAVAIERGEWWDRPALPFHVVLQAPSADVAELTLRWQGAGAKLSSVSR